MSLEPYSDALHIVMSDVDIYLTTQRKISIHSSLLAACSKFFARSLDPSWVKQHGSSSRPSDEGFAYRLDLKKNPSEDFLIRQDSTTDPNLTQPYLQDECPRDEAYYRALENLFDVFRHRRPILGNLQDILALIRLADKYDSLPVVSRAIRLYLMELGNDPCELFRQIAKNPVEYLYIGEKTRSVIVTKEASVHILGTWSETAAPCQELVSARLYESLSQIHRTLCQKKERANKMLLSLNYDSPTPLDLKYIHEAEAALLIIRENISKAFYNCMRQDAPEKFEGVLYRDIVKSTKIDKPALSFQYSQVSFEEGRTILDQKVQSAVGDLADNSSNLRSTDLGAGYLLCTKLSDADLTWNEEWE